MDPEIIFRNYSLFFSDLWDGLEQGPSEGNLQARLQ
jgi:hypothetical protein